jgi:hypothetical protein
LLSNICAETQDDFKPDGDAFINMSLGFCGACASNTSETAALMALFHSQKASTPFERMAGKLET